MDAVYIEVPSAVLDTLHDPRTRHPALPHCPFDTVPLACFRPRAIDAGEAFLLDAEAGRIPIAYDDRAPSADEN